MVMPSLHRALDRDTILRALSSFYGITTDDGNPGGTTLVCSTLIGSNDFISNKTILLQSGLAILEDSGAAAFNPVNGQITVNPAFNSQVLEGTGFYVLNASSVAMAMALMNQGLVYYGVVTDVPFANTFTIPTLADLGADKFIDLSAVTPYYAFVFRDAAGGGAAPQGEYQPITAYDTGGGTFTTPAFTAPVGIGDEILIIHPFLARTMNSAGLPPHVGSLAENWQSGVATSGETGADLVSIGAVLTKYKLHSLILNISTLTLGATITVKLFMDVVGTERKVYEQSFTQGTDPDGLWIVNGTLGIHEVLRVEVESNNAGDNGLTIDYDYMLEVM